SQRRFAVSIKSTARSGRRGIRDRSSNAPHPFRSRTGRRARVFSSVVVEVFNSVKASHLLRLRGVSLRFATELRHYANDLHSNCQAAKTRAERRLRATRNRSIVQDENRESYFWRGMFLVRGRNFPQFERGIRDSG